MSAPTDIDSPAVLVLTYRQVALLWAWMEASFKSEFGVCYPSDGRAYDEMVAVQLELGEIAGIKA